MVRENKRLKMGWIGRGVIIALVVGIMSSIFFFNLFNLNIKTLFGSNQEIKVSEDKKEKFTTPEETIEVVKKTQETIGKEYKDIGIFVSDMHTFYNNTTGYGGISSLDWKEQIEQAEVIVAAVEEKILTINDDALKADLGHLQKIANQTMKKSETDLVRDLHRIFHDLDIALNDYNGYDKIWNVTETLKVIN